MDTETGATTSDVVRTLGSHPPRARGPWHALKWAVPAILGIAAAYFLYARGTTTGTQYVTQEVMRGGLTVMVTATGNLEPRNQVDIGSELSGTVLSVNVDVNDEVKTGQMLAVLDTTRLKAQVLQAESSLASAEARVLQSEATLKEARSNDARLRELYELSAGQLPSQQDRDVAAAAVGRAEGDNAAARATVAQTRASLEAVRTDLSKTKIRSPISGIVLARSVEPGQTVAASLQAPILFTLAEDLKKMELHVSVDEADVGSVQIGQEATFAVDAFPNRRFSARITQVHFASSNTGSSSSSEGTASATSTGVVTYETVLEVDNPELLLRPGMTATAEIVTTRIDEATLIPNAALRFAPEGTGFPGASNASQQQASPLSALMPQMRRPMGGVGAQQRPAGAQRVGRAWILEEGKPALVMFRTGASDGRMTQVLELGPMPTSGRMGTLENEPTMKRALERRLEPGMQVIVDSEAPRR